MGFGNKERVTNLMNHPKIIFVLFTIAVGFGIQAQAQTPSTNAIYDLAQDISQTSNPNGVWSYGWKESTNGAFNLFTSPITTQFVEGIPLYGWGMGGVNPAIYWNPSTTASGTGDGGTPFPPRVVWVYAGNDMEPENFGVIRFTVANQRGGVYQLQSAAKCYLDGTVSKDADYHVVLNGVEVFSQFLAPNSATGYTTNLSLAAGDTIDFMSGRGADGDVYGSGLKMQITLTTPSICSPHAAKATAVTVNGFVVGINISDEGCGYTNVPTVKISGGGGSGATAIATINNGAVTGVVITDAGLGYTNVPSVLIASPEFTPWLDICVSKVKVTEHLVLGLNYILESSPDLSTWTQVGGQFTAGSELITQEFDVEVTGRYFRLRQVP
jgi:hypothetical protein